jgi:putative membrane protein
MKTFILHLVGLSLVVYYLLPEVVQGVSIQDYRSAIIAAVLFAFINIAVKPILRIIMFPFNLVTLGLFGFVVNILLFWFVASIITGFSVASFNAALFGALVMTAANWIIEKVVR